jgi:hypothetical protein
MKKAYLGGCGPPKPLADLGGSESRPEKELPFHGVYFVKSGKLRLLDKDPQWNSTKRYRFFP